jgi:hypothetical protein
VKTPSKGDESFGLPKVPIVPKVRHPPFLLFSPTTNRADDFRAKLYEKLCWRKHPTTAKKKCLPLMPY